MSEDRGRKYLTPLFYTLVWCIGLCIGVFGLLPSAVGSRRMIIAALSVYGIFCANTLLDILFYYLRAFNERVKPTFAYIMIAFTFSILAVMTLSHLYVDCENVLLLISVLIVMGLTNYGMGVIKHNPSICFEEIKGLNFKSNFK